ncbi:glycosyltransferase family 4 protein [Thiolapillus brandeum]|uniref:Glycosyl transferase family 1 domain-containing protein n=1 Tax=Thiolapillus brandeum TaxID=1076588 RepID=A0A7U6JGR8_9GAMM|nr:glycosyltransferase family 4 protein [Thiolapillus brandeum]BAO43686.1 conserved hypothetical protein [Thiolapillus brandeum]
MNRGTGVAIYSPSAGIWGGGQIYIEQLCNYLNARDIPAWVYSSEPETFACPARSMRPARARRDRLVHAMGLASEWKRQCIGQVVLNDLASLWLAPLFRLQGLRVISLLHLYLQPRSHNPLGHGRLEYFLLRRSAPFCHHIFSVNRDNVAVLGERVRFVGNFVPQWFFPQPGEARPEKTHDFLFVGRFARQKNLPLFLRLLKNLRDTRGRRCTALLLGEGEEWESIQRLVKEWGLQGQVDFSPWVSRENLPHCYDRGRCFVISSLHEGFATTLLEAHARGVPALVTRSSGFCAEFVEEYGQPTGRVFVPEDVHDEEFLKAVERLLDRSPDLVGACMDKARLFDEDRVLGPIAECLRYTSGTV